MTPFLAEIVGTMLLVVLGDGVVANVLLQKSKGQNSGWIVIATGWALAVTFAVYAVSGLSQSHFNPAVTLAAASIGRIAWGEVPGYIVAQMIGGFLGGVLVWVTYLPHWRLTEDKGLKLAVFCTGPAVRDPLSNLITEAVATGFLVVGLLSVLRPANLGGSTGFAPLLVGLIVFAIGLSLGGPTGYAINPARDLGPRIAHAVLPVAGKGGSDWGYAWIPVVGPIVGGIAGALVYRALWGA
jgi:glycerol uptake facilitator protein